MHTCHASVLLSSSFPQAQVLQGLKQQYTEELTRLTEASQAAAEALRQRLRRLTGERALSGKSPAAAAAAATATGSSTHRNLPAGTADVPQSSTAAYVPASLPRSDSIQSAASTAGTTHTTGLGSTAAPAGLSSSWSATRLSDSWGSITPADTPGQQSDYASIPQFDQSQETSTFAPPAVSNLQHAENEVSPGQAGQSAQHSMQSVPRTMSDSKPPKPASSFQSGTYTDQQASSRRQSMETAPTQPGVLPNQMGRKSSLMSAGSGYQADSDSNSDTQVEPGTLSRLAASSSNIPDNTSEGFPDVSFSSTTAPVDTNQHTKADSPSSASGMRSAQLQGSADSETGHAAEESDSKQVESETVTEPESPSLLGRATQLVGNTVWGAVHPIQAAEAVAEYVTGHSGEDSNTADDKSAAALDTVEADGSQATDGHKQQSAGIESEAAYDSGALPSRVEGQQPERTESGYESDVDLPGNNTTSTTLFSSCVFCFM